MLSRRQYCPEGDGGLAENVPGAADLGRARLQP
jgi:hypothetical protein